MPLRRNDTGGRIHTRLQRAAGQMTRAAAGLADIPFADLKLTAAERDLIIAARRVERDAHPDRVNTTSTAGRTASSGESRPPESAQILAFPRPDPQEPIAG